MTKQELEKEIKKICDEKGWGYERAKKHLMSEMYQSFAEPTETEGKSYAIKSMPVFKIGLHHDTPYTLADLDEIVKNTNALLKAKLIDPPIKLGHDENQKMLQADGYPAGGYVQNIERMGDELFVDVDDMPDKLYQCIKKRAYKHISPEIYENYPHPVTKENMGKVLKAVAVLGADIPEVKGLGDILNMFGARTKIQKFSFAKFSADDLQEASVMKTDWTLERASTTYPCCVKEFKKFAEDNKTKTIPGDKVAEIVAVKNAANFDGEPIQCPDGFSFDEQAQRCMPSSNDKEKTKPEEQKVCPKGWSWDEATGKCVKTETQENAAAGTKPKMDAKKLLAEMLKARGKKIDDTKDIDEQMPDEAEMNEMISKMKAGAEPSDKNPDEWTDDDTLNIKAKHESDPEKDMAAQTGDEPPKEWLDKCMAKATGKSAAPDKMCAHVWTKQMSPEAKTKHKNPAEKTQSEEVKQMNEDIRKLVTKRFSEAVNSLKEKHRNILVPALDSAVDTLTEHIAKNEAVIKFAADGKPEKSFGELWVEFLKDIVSRKALIFGEMAKANGTAGKGETKMEIIKMSEEDKAKRTKIFSEIAPGLQVGNLEFAESAKAYAAEKKIPLKQAQQELGKMLREQQKQGGS